MPEDRLGVYIGKRATTEDVRKIEEFLIGKYGKHEVDTKLYEGKIIVGHRENSDNG